MWKLPDNHVPGIAGSRRRRGNRNDRQVGFCRSLA